MIIVPSLYGLKNKEKDIDSDEENIIVRLIEISSKIFASFFFNNIYSQTSETFVIGSRHLCW